METKVFTYGAYARKSSESEDRQVQSIPRQIDDFNEVIAKEHLCLSGEIISETQSAFSIGREGFAGLIALTENGTINAWLCWHANRLSRNPIDAGMIIHLMDQGKLDHIRTPSRVYYNTPTDKMMLQIEFTMSKKDSDDKSVFVKSGLKKRYKKGLPNGKAPIGYLNDKSQEKGERGWLVDSERFEKLQLLFKRFLKGEDSLNSITNYARNELKLTSAPSKRQGGILVGRSSVEHILKNSIYAGFFYSSNEEGNKRDFWTLDKNISRVITEDEHIRVLNIFGSRKAPIHQRHQTLYSGFLYGPDGSYLGADVKMQLICDCTKKFAYRGKENCPSCGVKIQSMQSPKYLTYTYYHNIKRKKTPGLSCKGIREDKIDAKLIELFTDEIVLPPALFRWAKKHLDILRDNKLLEQEKLYRIFQQELKNLDEKKSRLKELFINQLITKEEFKTDVLVLEQQQKFTQVQSSLSEDWYELVDATLHQLFNFKEILTKGTFQEKRELLSLLGPNLIWDEEKLLFHKPNWLKVFKQGRKKMLAQIEQSEPKKNLYIKGLNGALDTICPIVLSWLDKFRISLQKHQAKLLKSTKKETFFSKYYNSIN